MREIIDSGEAPQPDWDDFKMPWRLYGKFSQELMEAKFARLHNYSRGNYLRLTGHFEIFP